MNSITHVLIIFFIFQQPQSSLDQYQENILHKTYFNFINADSQMDLPLICSTETNTHKASQ